MSLRFFQRLVLLSLAAFASTGVVRAAADIAPPKVREKVVANANRVVETRGVSTDLPSSLPNPFGRQGGGSGRRDSRHGGARRRPRPRGRRFARGSRRTHSLDRHRHPRWRADPSPGSKKDSKWVTPMRLALRDAPTKSQSRPSHRHPSRSREARTFIPVRST
jgi:hypothetical protein